MRAVVVYEAESSSTQQVAFAIAKGLAHAMKVDVVEASDVERIDVEVELLVVGGSTYLGLREWVERLPRAWHRRTAAAFDTHLHRPRWLPGPTARGVAQRLFRLGYRLATPPQSFYLRSAPGPRRDGELARAHLWGEQLGVIMAARAPRPLPTVAAPGR